jgi:hypothetical protein
LALAAISLDATSIASSSRLIAINLTLRLYKRGNSLNVIYFCCTYIVWCLTTFVSTHCYNTSNQWKFYSRFNAIVLLSAPLEVILERVASRTTNDYGKTTEQREEIINFIMTVEPLLRSKATFEIDTRKPINQVASELEVIATHQGINTIV